MAGSSEYGRCCEAQRPAEKRKLQQGKATNAIAAQWNKVRLPCPHMLSLAHTMQCYGFHTEHRGDGKSPYNTNHNKKKETSLQCVSMWPEQMVSSQVHTTGNLVRTGPSSWKYGECWRSGMYERARNTSHLM